MPIEVNVPIPVKKILKALDSFFLAGFAFAFVSIPFHAMLDPRLVAVMSLMLHLLVRIIGPRIERWFADLKPVSKAWSSIAVYAECPHCAWVNLRSPTEFRRLRTPTLNCDSCKTDFRIVRDAVRMLD